MSAQVLALGTFSLAHNDQIMVFLAGKSHSHAFLIKINIIPHVAALPEHVPPFLGSRVGQYHSRIKCDRSPWRHLPNWDGSSRPLATTIPGDHNS